MTLDSSCAYSAYIKPVVSYHAMNIVGTKGIVRSYGNEEDSVEPTLVSETFADSFCPDKSSNKSGTIGELLADFADAVEGRKPVSPEMAMGEDGLMAQIIMDEANRQAVMQKETIT